MSQYIDVALEAAQNAEKTIMRYFDSQVAYERKDDNSPVTIADKEAERIIRETISKYFPAHSIMGEEHPAKVGDTKYQWIIDPIDGTKNFLRKLPHFGTLIALLEDDHVIAAVSNMPVLKECMYAEKGGGAFLNDRQVHVSDVKELRDSFLLHGGLARFKEKNLLDSLLELSAETMGHRGFGDCWMYHLLAQGKVDIVLEARIKPWDIAAGSLLVTEAGGIATDLTGKKIGSESTSFVGANKHLYERVFSRLIAK